MASPNPKMQYWDSSGTAQWRDALTWAGNNAVLFCTINKSLGSPSTAELILSNRPKDASSTDTSKSTGIFSGTQDANNRTKATIFNEFQDIRIIEEESGMILFRGRLYHIKSHYDYQYGQSVKLVAKDLLQELLDIPTDEVPEALTKIDLTDSATNKRSGIIEKIVTEVSDNFALSDSTKFETSVAALTANEAITTDGNNYRIDTGQQQVLGVLKDLSMQDPHAVGDTKHFGYDYYVDANAVSNVATSQSGDSGKVSFNYFQRGNRPHASDIPNYGVTLEYPSSGWGGQTNFRRAMLSDAEFTNPNGTFYTAVVNHYVDKGGDDEFSKAQVHGIQVFELIQGNIPATIAGGAATNFPWLDSDGVTRLQVINDGWAYDGDHETDYMRYINATNADITINNTQTGGANFTVYPGQSTNPHNPRFIFATGATNPCGVVQYQSGVGSDSYLMLSNVYEVNTNYTDFQGNSITFDAFPDNPAEGSTIRLHLAKGQGANDDDYPYIDMAHNGRTRDRYNINKPYRSKLRSLSSFDAIRKSAANLLDRGSKAMVTIGKVRTSRYPAVKLIARASYNHSRSNNQITLGNNSISRSDGNALQYTNDITLFGAKKGMVIAELDGSLGVNTRVMKYGYISNISGANVTYGASTTDNSDGTVALDHTKDLAIFIPVEPGHKVRLKNKLHGVDYDIIVRKITYNYSPGSLSTQLEGSGTNVNEFGVLDIPAEHVNVSLASNTSDDSFTVNIPPATQKWQISDGSLTSDGTNLIKLASTIAGRTVTLRLLSDDREYSIDIADGTTVNSKSYPKLEIGETGGTFNGDNDTTDQWHVIFFRTRGNSYKSRGLQAIAVARSGGSGLIWDDIRLPTDIIIGMAKKHDQGCLLYIDNNGLIGSTGFLDLDAIGTNRFSTAILKPSARPWQSNLDIQGTAWNTITWNNGTANTDATLEFANGDVATIADGSATLVTQSSAGPPADSTDDKNGKTQYMYITLPASPDSSTPPSYGTLTPAFTTDFSVSMAESNVVLANLVADKDANTSAGNQPTPLILPFNSKTPTLNTIVLRADSINADYIQSKTVTSDHIEAGSITTDELKLTGSKGFTGIIVDGGEGKLNLAKIGGGSLNMDSDYIADGSAYVKPKAGNFSNGFVNLSSTDLAGSLSLDKTADGTTYKLNDLVGGKRAYAALNSANRYAGAIGTGESGVFYSYNGTTKNIIVIDSEGIKGISGLTNNFDIDNPILDNDDNWNISSSGGDLQFVISTGDGSAYFGGFGTISGMTWNDAVYNGSSGARINKDGITLGTQSYIRSFGVSGTGDSEVFQHDFTQYSWQKHPGFFLGPSDTSSSPNWDFAIGDPDANPATNVYGKLTFDGSAKKLKLVGDVEVSEFLGGYTTPSGGGTAGYGIKVDNSGLTLGTVSNPLQGNDAAEAPNDTTGLRFGWHATSIPSAITAAATHVSLVGRKKFAADIDVYNQNMFELMWYQNGLSNGTGGQMIGTQVLFNHNTGILANFSAMGAGGVGDGENDAISHMFMAPPRNIPPGTDDGHVTTDADWSQLLHPMYEPMLVLSDDGVSVSTSVSAGYADNPWQMRVGQKTNSGVYTGNGYQALGQEIDTGIKSLVCVMIWELVSHTQDGDATHVPAYLESSNRRSSEGDWGILVNLWGRTHSEHGSGLSSSDDKAIFEPKSNKWFGGRGKIGVGATRGWFIVYNEGTFWDAGDNYQFNKNGVKYFWMAWG